jgi:hypothetical protein
MPLRWTATAALAALALGALNPARAAAQASRPDAATVALSQLRPVEFRRLQLSGEQVRANVERLTQRLRWYKTLGGALHAARSSGKPAVWIQALGDLDGFL